MMCLSDFAIPIRKRTRRFAHEPAEHRDADAEVRTPQHRNRGSRITKRRLLALRKPRRAAHERNAPRARDRERIVECVSETEIDQHRRSRSGLETDRINEIHRTPAKRLLDTRA